MHDSAQAARPLHVRELGLRRYRPVLELQRELVEQRRAGTVPDTLLLVEHEPVYTLGRSAKAEHLLLGEAERARRGIEAVAVGRGGDVTYHGPGQLVGYPILDLGARERGLSWYVTQLEEVLIRTLADFGVAAGRDARNRGVWIGNAKIAAIGVRVTRRVTMHGFALNVNPDLREYDGIVPCGVRDADVTALERCVPGITVHDVKPCLVNRFADVFGYVRADTHAPSPGTPDEET
jgi:lipoyl(octanoyl) transferase